MRNHPSLLENEIPTTEIQHPGDDYFFVKSERKFIKIHFEEILFIEGLKDYVVRAAKNMMKPKVIRNKSVVRVRLKKQQQLPSFITIGKRLKQMDFMLC